MRTEEEMLDMILSVAEMDERVRVVGINGSRTNPNVPKDNFQDYDVVYVVTEMQSYIEKPSWIDVFGKRIILQTPEAMDMFPPEIGNWFSYLMLFEDYTRIDLTLVPITELDQYIQSDKLIQILLDKDGLVPKLPPPSDIDFWVKKPSASYFDDCCNEFWWLSTYVAKGLCRGELPYAIDHLAIMRNLLLTMLSWEVGIGIDFSASMGKNFKYLNNYLATDTWNRIMQTYRNDTAASIWDALWTCCDLFRDSGNNIAMQMGFIYPDYDRQVTHYLNQLHQTYLSH